jgi:hypothetical protein
MEGSLLYCALHAPCLGAQLKPKLLLTSSPLSGPLPLLLRAASAASSHNHSCQLAVSAARARQSQIRLISGLDRP